MADKAHVKNPAPKDTKTVNDSKHFIISSYWPLLLNIKISISSIFIVFGHEKTGTLKQNEIKPTLRESRVNELNSDLRHNSINQNEYDDAIPSKRSKASLSVKKVRNANFATNPTLTDNSFSYTKKLRLKVPQNDFDSSTVKDGLDAIDIELDEIDKIIQNEELAGDGNGLDELVKANKALREKVEQIADLVVSAITKASNIK